MCVFSVAVLSLLVTQGYTASADGNCQNDWMPCMYGAVASDTFCINVLDKILARDPAQVICGKMGMTPPEIHTWGEQRELERFLREKGITYAFWLDGSYERRIWRSNVKTFSWETKLFPKINNLKPNQQSNSACVVMKPLESYIWETHSCNFRVNVICVKKRVPNWYKFHSEECKNAISAHTSANGMDILR